MNSIKNYFQSPIKENINSTIIENMTAVIKSGKKKRKRNKIKDSNESVISDISQTLSCNLHFESDNNILNVSDVCNEMTSPEHVDNTPDKKSKIKNVFEVMMDARNRVIGSNSNGIVLDTEPVNQETTPTSVKNKRKLMLEKWCDEKGKNERMVKEEAVMEHINKKMYKRAERLKQLLTNNGSEANKAEENKSESKKNEKKLAKKKLELEDEVENETTSPSNKRDILGYFPKLNGSLEEKNENIRPRRSCAKNRSYIFDLRPGKIENSLSPTATPNKRTKRSSNRTPTTKSKKQKLDSDDEVEFTSCETEKPKRRPKGESKNIKLAPLFVKQLPKPAIDPEILKARHEFLMSGIPDSLRLEMARQKTYEDEFELNYSYFPEISHITQLDSKYIQNGNGKIIFKSKNCAEQNIVVNYDKLKLGLITNCDSNSKFLDFSKYNGQQEIQKIPRKNLITLIKNLKNDCNNYPVYRCYKQLKLKCNEHIMDKTIQNEVQSMNDISFKNGNQLFNEKFKPKCLNEIYINYRQGVELKRFLSNWQENYYNHKLSDESLSNSVSSINTTSNFVVLIGPYGCGKTNSVYAMAQEMNFKVLEINCGSKRTGKKMLQKLHEATQSHNVHQHTNSQKMEDTDSRSDTDINTKKLALVLIEDSDIVFEQDDGFINAINQLISTSKRPVVLISNTPHSNHLLKFIEQNSIIYDAPSLVNVAKYISLLGLVEHCFLDYGELGKLIQYNQNDLRRTINMVQFFIQSGGDRHIKSNSNSNKVKPVITKISDTFGLSEMLDVEDDNSKFSWYDSDEEKNILKRKSPTVQIHRNTKIFEFFTSDQNYSSKFHFYGNFDNLWLNLPAVFLSKYDSNIKAKKKSKKSEDLKTINTLNQISNFYDSVSVALVLDTDTTNQDFSYSCDLSKEIVSTIVEYSLELNNVDYKNYNVLLNNNHDSLDLLYNNLTSTLGSSTTARTVSTQSVALDYEPYLRSMCRVEKVRRHNTDRRSTRFYHYLRNSINTCTFGTELFDKHVNILNDQLD